MDAHCDVCKATPALLYRNLAFLCSEHASAVKGNWPEQVPVRLSQVPAWTKALFLAQEFRVFTPRYSGGSHIAIAMMELGGKS